MGTWNTTNLSELEFQRIEAEFYQKKFINAKQSVGNKSLKFYDVKVIHPAEVRRIYSDSGELQIVLAQNVRDNVMDWKGTRYMDKSMRHLIARNKLEEGDVLVTRSGANYGQTSVITIEPKQIDLFACADVLILKSGNIGGPLLSTFLNTVVGKLLMVRGVYGAGQPHVAPSYISHISFPEFLLTSRDEIENIIYKSRKLQQESITLYQKATTLLKKELGLDKITFDNPKSYTASFSEVVNSNRADADFYQVKFKQLEEHISTLKTTALASICSFQKGYEVGTKLYTDDGPTFIRVSNLTINGFTFGNSDKYISNNTYNIFKAHKPNIGDILLTKDGTIGACYVVEEEVEGIVSSGIMNLTLNDTSIPKEYLALVINSQICQMQADRDCSGALITHWKPEQIRKMKIPILSSETMEHLADLVTRSKAARKESKQLIEQAKNRVEELIEEAAKK